MPAQTVFLDWGKHLRELRNVPSKIGLLNS